MPLLGLQRLENFRIFLWYCMCNLHWLPVTKRIQFKILTITYKALNGMAPSYICDLLQVHHPNRNLRHGSAFWSIIGNTCIHTGMCAVLSLSFNSLLLHQTSWIPCQSTLKRVNLVCLHFYLINFKLLSVFLILYFLHLQSALRISSCAPKNFIIIIIIIIINTIIIIIIIIIIKCPWN